MFDFKIKVEGLDWPIQKLRDQFDPWDKIEETKHLFCLFTMHCRLNGVLACRSIFICKTPSYTCKNKKRPYERPKPAKKCIWVPLALLLYSSPHITKSQHTAIGTWKGIISFPRSQPTDVSLQQKNKTGRLPRPCRLLIIMRQYHKHGGSEKKRRWGRMEPVSPRWWDPVLDSRSRRRGRSTGYGGIPEEPAKPISPSISNAIDLCYRATT